MSNVSDEDQLRFILTTFARKRDNVVELDELNSRALLSREQFELDLTESRALQIASDICNSARVTMTPGGSVVDQRSFKPWLNKRKTETAMPRSVAYERLLQKRGWSGRVIDALDKQTDEIVELMGDPTVEGSWSRHGLVIGEVQSGKTATYIGALNKAMDLGYKLIIIIGGHTEDLRRQTQARVDSDLLGFDTSFETRGSTGYRKSLGIGEIDSEIKTLTRTNVRQDFSKASRTAGGFDTDAPVPQVFVVKKNKSVLENLARIFRSSISAGQTVNAPLIVIDDEADWASVNTAKVNATDGKESDRTAINRAIIQLTKLSDRSTYLAITATPFANILIDESQDDDLFPSDYICALNSPSDYRGVQYYFEQGPGEQGKKSSRLQTDIADSLAALPLKHKSTARIQSLPDSLIRAIDTFILATAIRYTRSGKDDLSSSMMVNMSRFNAVQQSVFDQISEHVEYRGQRLRAGLGLAGTQDEPTDVASLADLFADTYPRAELTFVDLVPAILSVVARLKIELVNSQTTVARDAKNEALTTQQLADERALPTIYVGGIVLARGLTLDGLVVSYFTRIASAADTLLQMGRWFGYRPNYEDLVRVWIDAQVADLYSYTAELSADLRRSVGEMRELDLTPRHFGLRLRMHPESFQITAANKSRAGTIHEGPLSIFGTVLESAELSTVPEHRIFDRERLNSFARRLLDTGLGNAASRSGDGDRVTFHNVDHALVTDFVGQLKSILSPMFNIVFKSDASARPEELDEIGLESGWTVIFESGEKKNPVHWVADGLGVRLSSRNRVGGSTEKGLRLAKFGNRRVASGADTSHALTPELIAKVKAKVAELTETDKSRPANAMQTDYVHFGLQQPALFVYNFVTDNDSEPDFTEYTSQNPGLAIVVAFPSADREALKRTLERGKRVRWIANSVWMKENANQMADSSDSQDSTGDEQ